jgi:lipopolysaccharide export LptBFGC system permease protein LptF
MPDESPMNDPQKIWQDQPTEAMKMSLDEIRRKAQRLRTKGRLAALLTIVIGLVLCVFFALTASRPQEVVSRIGWGMLSLWGLYAAYQAYRWTWPGTLAADATLSTSLDFYRRELERRHDYARHVWRRAGLTFCFAGLALVVLPALIGAFRTPRLLLNVVPLFVLLIIWFVVFFSMRRRNQRRLRREIDELKMLGGENRS